MKHQPKLSLATWLDPLASIELWCWTPDMSAFIPTEDYSPLPNIIACLAATFNHNVGRLKPQVAPCRHLIMFT